MLQRTVGGPATAAAADAGGSGGGGGGGDGDGKAPAADRAQNSSVLWSLWAALRAPPILSTLVGIGIGLVRPLSDALFADAGALAGLGQALVSIGNVSVFPQPRLGAQCAGISLFVRYLFAVFLATIQ
jgi:hypothetical protein